MNLKSKLEGLSLNSKIPPTPYISNQPILRSRYLCVILE